MTSPVTRLARALCWMMSTSASKTPNPITKANGATARNAPPETANPIPPRNPA